MASPPFFYKAHHHKQILHTIKLEIKKKKKKKTQTHLEIIQTHLYVLYI